MFDQYRLKRVLCLSHKALHQKLSSRKPNHRRLHDALVVRIIHRGHGCLRHIGP